MWGERDPTLPQRNFEARQQECTAALRSCLLELELDIGEGPRGVYDQGQEYEYYRDISGILKLAQKEIFIADPYLNKEIFEVYADVIDRSVHFRLSARTHPPTLKQSRRCMRQAAILNSVRVRLFMIGSCSRTIAYGFPGSRLRTPRRRSQLTSWSTTRS